ncbi:DUF4251 domain-containing protein [Leptobacterium flavescens]|uniref:DUF4251 domain-containing protein n=1 Tax=Leptobacterium flavescens TaxID=472055 RepID=A0A6P0UMC4_9FLAO|nr:DUF4251 domain-containing protein [Leptobacterium flavescens]NER13600.1 DUF4251 domain-containing protein [Leptobacterium flavescens]
MKKFIILLLFSAFMINTADAQSRAERKKLKAEKADAEYAQMKELVNSGAFVFEAQWATPLGSSRINLLANPNHLKIRDGEADTFFPYFGFIRTGGSSYNRNGGGIEFRGEPVKYTTEFNDKKRAIILKLSAKNDAELYDVILTINRSGTATASVNSSFRSSIFYEGFVKELEDTE